MKSAAYHHDYPYRLRLLHPEYAEIRLERKGRFLRIDPAEAPEDDEIVVLTSAAPHRARATVEALQAGRRLSVIATRPVLDWLAGMGTIEASTFPHTVDGVAIDALGYSPPRLARPLAQVLRASVAGARPGGTFRRFAEHIRFPATEPQALELRLEDGGRLVHLDLALHAHTDPAWVERAAARFQGADWLLVGVPWNEGDALVRHLPRFGAKRVLVTELQNSERREVGLPTELVTPTRDKLVAAGIEAHVFATQASYRFE